MSDSLTTGLWTRDLQRWSHGYNLGLFLSKTHLASKEQSPLAKIKTDLTERFSTRYVGR